MTIPLPADGPERTVFLVALRKFSEECIPPDLSPGCPFRVPVGPGQYGCAEECMDLLGLFEAPGPIQTLSLGDGIAMTRIVSPRARRGSSTGSGGFDARQIYLQDRDKPLAFQSAVSLFYGVVSSITVQPPDEPEDAESRRRSIIEAVSELSDRGVEAEAYLPFLEEQLQGPIALSVIFDFPDGQSAVRTWRGALRIDEESVNNEDLSKESVELFAKSLKRIDERIRGGSLDDLIAWRPADADRKDEADGEERDEGIWLGERLHRTYLREWSLTSLRLEWQYLHGRIPGPCRPEIMRTRGVGESELAIELADRVAMKDMREPSRVSVARYAEEAMALLRMERYDEAATYFRVVADIEPTNAEAHNNLGFCLMPTSPEEALRELETASTLGYFEPVVNGANQLRCLYGLSRFVAALNLAEDLWPNASPDATALCLWNVGSDGAWTLDERPRVALHIALLALLVAQQVGDSALIDLWQERVGLATG